MIRSDIFRTRICQLLAAICLLCWQSVCFAEDLPIATTPSKVSYLYWFLALLACLLAGYFVGSKRRVDEETYQAEMEKKLSASELRLKQQQAALSVLTTQQLKNWQDPADIFREITKISAETLDVERVSIWLFNQDKTELECMDLYLKSKNLHTVTKSLHLKQLPAYFTYLSQHRVIAANDIMRHPSTVELTKGYAQENSIGAMLDGTIWLNNEVIGATCHEHVGGMREWTLDEQAFVGSVADLARLTIETDRRRKAEQALIKQNENLELIVQARTRLLQESQKTFEYVVKNAPIPILILDSKGDIVDANPEAQVSTGFTESITGKNFIELIVSEESRKKAVVTAARAMKGKDFKNVELVLQSAQGAKIEYECSLGAVVQNAQNGQNQVVAIARNVSHQKALQASLIQAREAAESADRIKSMFVASMSHELRTPLNSILGFLGVVLQGMSGELNIKQKDQLGRAYHSAKHLLALISDVIDISKIEAGFLNVYVEKFDLNQLLSEVEHAVQHLADEKHLVLTMECAKKIAMETDRKRLYQVVLNVVSNALKYTEQGSVKVVASTKGKQVVVTVEDTGIGIDEASLAKLFKPFERAESRLKIKTLGTGLGLYLTRKILSQLLGGSIEVKSKPEQGSTFTIYLPTKMPDFIVQANASILEEHLP